MTRSVDHARRDHAEESAGEEVRKRLVHRAAGKGSEIERDAVIDRARRDRRDDRLQAAVDDDGAVDRPAGESDEQHARRCRAPPASGSPTTMAEATQLVSVKIMPTERSMPAGDHDQRLRHGDQCQQHRLVGGGVDDVRNRGGREALAFDRRMVDEVDEEHHQEDAERQQRPPLLREPEAPILHAFTAGRPPTSPA